MKIYLAARIALRYQMRNIRDVLHHAGHTVTSRWVDDWFSVGNITPEECCRLDLEDIRSAEILVPFSDQPGIPQLGGGRHVEYGIALERNMRIMVVGPKGEHVFHFDPRIKFYNNIYEIIKELE